MHRVGAEFRELCILIHNPLTRVVVNRNLCTSFVFRRKLPPPTPYIYIYIHIFIYIIREKQSEEEKGKGEGRGGGKFGK